MTLVVPLFKEGAFKIGPKLFKDHAADFAKFKSANDYYKYRKYADKPFESDRVVNNKIDRLFNADLRKELKTKENPNLYTRVKGTIEAGNILGSVLGLAILAPQVSHAIIHPCLRALGMEEKKSVKAKAKIDTKA